MEDQILKKLENHDKRFDSVDKRFDSMDDRLDVVARTVVDNQNKLEQHDIRLNTLAVTVVDIKEQINDIKETMATKSDIGNLSNTLDELVGLAKKKDQELTFMGERVRRIEDDVKHLKPMSV